MLPILSNTTVGHHGCAPASWLIRPYAGDCSYEIFRKDQSYDGIVPVLDAVIEVHLYTCCTLHAASLEVQVDGRITPPMPLQGPGYNLFAFTYLPMSFHYRIQCCSIGKELNF
jgi:hypothetical protein